MKQLFITAAAFMLAVTFVYAVDSTKPTYHTSDWEIKHGQAAKANDTECFTCHEERVECISCHDSGHINRCRLKSFKLYYNP